MARREERPRASALRPLALLRSTGADLPFADLRAAHPGVALESHFWRFADHVAGRVVLAVCTSCRDAGGRSWASVAVAAWAGAGRTAVVAATFDDVAGIDEIRDEVGEISEVLRDPARFGRLYVAETALTQTGIKADARCALHPRDAGALLTALANGLGAGLPTPDLPPEAARFAAAAAADSARSVPAGA